MIEFNNGFITAIALFLEHKNKDRELNKFNDLRLNGATDHLFDIEIPENLPENIKKRIEKASDKALSLRNEFSKDGKPADKIFKEFENILAQIDKEIFRTKKVVMRYR